MSVSIYTVRPNGSALWLPGVLAARLKVGRGARLSAADMASHELAALVESRRIANESGHRCDVAWHRKNGYAAAGGQS